MQNPRKLTATLFLTLLCAAVLAVALPGAAAHADLAEQLGSPSNSASLDQISGSMESWNKAQLLHLGMRSTPARLKLIADAQNYIFITVPYRFDDEESKIFLEAIRKPREEAKALGRNLDVRVMEDWSSPASSNMNLRSERKNSEIMALK